MTLSALLTFMLATTLLVTSPGPNGVLIARIVPTSGRAAGFAAIAGFFTAFYIHGTLSILGLSLILTQSATAFTLVKLAGAAYLIWVGAKSLMAAWKGTPKLAAIAPAQRARTLRKAYFEGLLTNGLNPKVSMFYLAVFPQFIPADAPSALTAYELVFVHSMINVVWFTAVVLLLSRLTAATRGERFQRWLKGVTGAVFIGFGLKLATYKPA